MGIDLLTALEKTSQWREGGPRQEAEEGVDVPSVSDDSPVVAQQNDQSLVALERALSGVKTR